MMRRDLPSAVTVMLDAYMIGVLAFPPVVMRSEIILMEMVLSDMGSAGNTRRGLSRPP